MDEDVEAVDSSSVGDRLRAAREEKGFSLEDIAAETRIPLRHLESLEDSDWDRLPAPTYTIGFAKSYASAVGLDRAEIAEQIRGEMGGTRTRPSAVETFEPADPARAMPKWLVLAAIAAVILIVIFFTWMQNREMSGPGDSQIAATEEPAPSASPTARPQQPAPPPAARGPVVLTAVAPAWIRVTDEGRTLFEGMMQPGQSFTVPPSASQPLLRAGAPEALRVTVGDTVAPPVGPAGQVTSNVSLKPADLLGQGTASGAGAGQGSENSLAQ